MEGEIQAEQPKRIGKIWIWILILFICSALVFGSIKLFKSPNGIIGSTIEIKTCIELQNMKENLAANYILKQNIDCYESRNWNNGQGFEPIGHCGFNGECDNGDLSYLFSGSFDGQGNNITGLYINRPSNQPSQDNTGLFGRVWKNGVISNVGLINVEINGGFYTGALVGFNYGKISNCYASGKISGQALGGLVGNNFPEGSIYNSHSNVEVNSLAGNAGGLVSSNAGIISNSYATGSVSGESLIGGLVGNNRGSIFSSYASGTISGFEHVGGLVGINDGGIVRTSYATGDVSVSGRIAGGLIGGSNNGEVSNSYASGTVSGNNLIGGLIGYCYGNIGPSISKCYSVGRVNSIGESVGGLIGAAGRPHLINDCYYDSQISEKPNSSIGEGKTTDEMRLASTFINWDFTNTWKINEKEYPKLIQ